MWAPYIIPVVAAIVAFASFYFATKSTRAQAAAGAHAVDAEAYTRAASIYEDTINSLRTDITNLRTDLAVARNEIRTLNGEIMNLRHSIEKRNGD